MITDITGISGSRAACYIAKEAGRHNKVFVAVSSGTVAKKLRDDLAFFVSCPIYILPEEDDIRLLYETKDPDYFVKRIGAQCALLGDSKAIVISPASAAVKKLPTPEIFSSGIIGISIGDVVDPKSLKKKLIDSGYELVEVIDTFGQFSSRGDIVDIFSAGAEDPIRIEFFGDEVDSIRLFDIESRRSIESVDRIEIEPASLFVPTDDAINALLEKIDPKKEGQLFEMISERLNPHIYSEIIDRFDIETAFLWDYLLDGAAVIVDPRRIYESLIDDGDRKAFYKIFKRDCIVFTPFSERIEGVDKIDELIEIKSNEIAPFNGKLSLLDSEVKDLLKAGYEVHIVSGTHERSVRIREYLDDAGHEGKVTYDIGNLSAGFVLKTERLAFISESDIFQGAAKKAVKRKKRQDGRIDFADFKKGDVVVHEQHGIGVFEGINTINADGEINDFIKIRYADSDVLYIPVEQMDMVQKYIGNEGKAPALSRLSGGSWKRTRAKARASIMEIAEDLVKLYAEREAAGGFAFSEDTVWQSEFEASFPYEETEDQLRAITEIKKDMEKPLPMDRLLCGDVGYGKTEVAARAIFKCISEGKQAALLAPTTILVNQHFNTLSERFGNYPFEVRMLSRFNSEAENDKAVRDLAAGYVDLVIGTHRLLSEDVKFKDLGLIVIDEEQRFGVKHKEKLKMMKKSVDVLTLSATPIPRTLNMSMTGIKDISMIEEPPEDRYPVRTYVTPEDEELIGAVIRRELNRGGQVFIVNNRIAGIKALADRVKELVPDASVTVSHGRMNETALENVMIDFIDGKTDVLVATTIIENGIDIPNANTMIILNADMLGLAQLYQLRGRVGRSDRLAYAYLMYKPQKVITEIAQKRLMAIRDFTELGGGFRLAMRDLELRGAGNVLGIAQHGHIEGIGYELYCKEIDRAVKRLRGERVFETNSDVSIEIDIPARIPEDYISNETLKLQAYKKIAGIDSEDAALDFIDELIDRYGDIPDITMNLIKIAEIRGYAERIGIESIAERGNRITLIPHEKNELNAFVLIMTKEVLGDSLTITGGQKTSVSLYVGSEGKIDKLLELMRTLYRNVKENDKPLS